ncbi:MAG: 50S ribosomal protein L23 [Parachlamydiales bacterium]|nr:50S ribosomal protein L23 [Parachlamydiales bacterium]
MKNPYDIIKSRYITEKSSTLASLKDSESNKCIRKFNKPKIVFLVDREANKKEIAWAIEKIYEEKKVKVLSVNTINIHPKKKRVRGHIGRTKHQKKAIVTFQANDSLEEQV